MVVAQEKTGSYGLSAGAPQPRRKRRRLNLPRGPRLALTGMILAFFLTGVLITYYYSQVFALGYKIHRLDKELARLRVENHDLDGKIRRLSSLDRVEYLAVSKLGMVKPDSSKVLVVSVAGRAEANAGPPAKAEQAGAASPGEEEKSLLIKAFSELVDRLENKIWLGLGSDAGSEEGRNANNKYYDPEKNNRTLSDRNPGAPRADRAAGLASACGRG